MKRPYAHLDVFADEAFSGNQLAVFIDAVGLDRDCMQRIAGEMAFAETTFVFPSESPDTDALRLQGVAMGRPSRIAISVSSRNGGVSEVRVGGTCVSLGSGFLEIPETAA